MADKPNPHCNYSRIILRGMTILGYEDGEVVIQEGGRIFRVSREQAARRRERQQALNWVLGAIGYDTDAVLDLLGFQPPTDSAHSVRGPRNAP
jgi:hypothetical protein